MHSLFAASMRKLRGMIARPRRGGAVDASSNPFVEIDEPLRMRDLTYTYGSAPAAEMITLDAAVEPLWIPEVGNVAPPELEPWCYCI